MLSKTLIGNGFGCWKTIVTRRRSRVGSIAVMSTSSSRMRPLSRALVVSSVSRLSERNRVALAHRQRDAFDGFFGPVVDRDVVDLHPPDRELRCLDRASGDGEAAPLRRLAVAVVNGGQRL